MVVVLDGPRVSGVLHPLVKLATELFLRRSVSGLAGHVVGCGGLYPLSDHEAAIRKMYLLPMARGHGLGGALLQSLIEAARAKGVHRLSLETKSVLHEAIALYRRFGFTETPLVSPHTDLPATPRADRAFALDLVPLI